AGHSSRGLSFPVVRSGATSPPDRSPAGFAARLPARYLQIPRRTPGAESDGSRGGSRSIRWGAAGILESGHGWPHAAQYERAHPDAPSGGNYSAPPAHRDRALSRYAG